MDQYGNEAIVPEGDSIENMNNVVYYIHYPIDQI